MIQLILFTSLIFSPTDTLTISKKISDRKFSFTPKLFHHPQRVLFNSRAFDLEVFSDFPRDSVESLSLFYMTDAVPRYREIPFDPQEKRFSYRYDPRNNPANYITYFFTISLINGELYGTPVDSVGRLNPITKYLLDPIEYYKKRASFRN
ncbi:MAG: hypothetical protein ISR82_07500 [Candidatus Marinimicrobia bacterium]|nr:hypothetical protein [Candidatus Neomarinimicrobiota bacterium]MBL7011051.1 hypothetical protein [Candidatus Neomarinimicrobiota bacterium]MBL7031438.1 hypothetical protein [Candidatus Neomarinimicrobiota bacterium]